MSANRLYEIVNNEQGEEIDDERAAFLAGAAARMASSEIEDSPTAALIELLLGIAQIEDADIRRHVALRAAEQAYLRTTHAARGFNKFVSKNWGQAHKGVI